MDIYDYTMEAVRAEFLTVQTLKETPRSRVLLLRHRDTGKPYIFRHFAGNAGVYRQLLEVACPNLPQIIEVAEKDGQVLTLCQTLSVMVPRPLDIFPEDEPMETAQELQALLDRLDLIAGYDTIVTIFLPPAVYEGDLQISSHAVNLIGATDDDGNILTTIQGSIRVSTQRPDLVCFTDLCITGPGSGTGVGVSAGITLEHCVLSGWDIGAVANHGGFVAAHYTTFDSNGVGLKFKTGNYGHCDAGFICNTFTSNGTALQIEELAGDVELMFDQSLFSGNGVNVDNPTGHPVNLSAAIEE